MTKHSIEPTQADIQAIANAIDGCGDDGRAGADWWINEARAAWDAAVPRILARVHPMTEATPLASEQITQEDREALERLDDQLGFLTEVERPIVLEAFARHRIAALSASPAPSGQGVSGEVRKVAQALLIARTWPKHSDNCAYRTIPESEDGPWLDCNCDLVRNHKLIDDAYAIVEALAAPAPSCAPGEVGNQFAGAGNMVVELRDQLGKEAKDWRHNAYTRVMLAQMHDALAALSPQRLDAKEGGE